MTLLCKPPPLRVAALATGAAYGLFFLWTKDAPRDPRRRFGPAWLGPVITTVLAKVMRLCGVESAAVAPPGRLPAAPCVITCAPHGPYAVGHLCLSVGRFRTDARFAGHEDCVLGGASVLFRAPLLREALLALGVRDARRATLDAALAGGRSVALSTGGVWEQARTDDARERVCVLPNVGFVRLALRHGAPLVPCYAFGENQLYRTFDVAPRLRECLALRWRVGICVCWGKWWCPLLPRPTQHVVAVGRPVATAAAPCPNPTDAQVAAVLDAWVAEMRRLFDEHKHHLPPAVANRGLAVETGARVPQRTV